MVRKSISFFWKNMAQGDKYEKALSEVFGTQFSGPTGRFPNEPDPTTGLYGKLPYVPDALNSGFS